MAVKVLLDDSVSNPYAGRGSRLKEQQKVGHRLWTQMAYIVYGG